MASGVIVKDNPNDWGGPIINTVTTANVPFDQFFDVSVLNGTSPKEIMMTLQRVSNGRTFASTICAFGQFANAAIYAGGNFMITADAAYINVVCIYGADTFEIAAPPLAEAIRIRVFVRR